MTRATVPEREKEHISVFDWRKQDKFCSKCGKSIGKFAFRHSGLCQGCNQKKRYPEGHVSKRMRKMKQKELDALRRVSG